MKKLHLRYFGNVLKALTDSGVPLVFAPPFKSFLVTYDDWNDMTNEAKQQHIKSFMSYIPSPDDLLDVLTARKLCLDILREIFTEAEEIVNSIKKRMKIVSSSTSHQLLIMSPKPRNGNLLQCKC